MLGKRMFQWSDAIEDSFRMRTGSSLPDIMAKIQEEDGVIEYKHWKMGDTYICSGISMHSFLHTGMFVQAKPIPHVICGLIKFQRHWKRMQARRLAVMMGAHPRLGAHSRLFTLDPNILKMFC